MSFTKKYKEHSKTVRAKRKTQAELIEGIFKALKDGRSHNADEISRLSGLNWSSVIRWLDLICLIQNYPKVSRERVGRANIFQIPFEELRRR